MKYRVVLNNHETGAYHPLVDEETKDAAEFVCRQLNSPPRAYPHCPRPLNNNYNAEIQEIPEPE